MIRSLLLSFAAALLCSGCTAVKVVTMPVVLTGKAVLAVGGAAGEVVTAGGKVASSAARTTGNLASTGIDSAGKLGEAGMVTFVDASTGSVTRIPFQEGMTLAAGADAAKVKAAGKAMQLIRAGKLVKRAAGSDVLGSGDVVRLLR